MGPPASGRRVQAQETEVLPAGSRYRLATLCSLRSCGPKQGHCATTPHPQVAAHCPATAQSTFPQPFILGAKPGHSSPSLEDSPADGGRDERIRAWLGPNVPRTYLEHPVCGRPKGLNYCCSTGGKVPKIPGNRAQSARMGLVTPPGDGM